MLFNDYWVRATYGLGAILYPIVSVADRYGVYDDYEDYGYGGGNNAIGFIVLVIGAIASYGYLLSSHEEWQQRKDRNEKPQPIGDTTTWIFTIAGYLIVALFLCAPFFSNHKMGRKCCNCT